MNAATEGYNDLVKRIEDGFMEIDNDIIVDLRKQDDSYLALCRQIGDMERDYPFILNVTEGKGEISLTAEEHRILVEYFRLSLKKDNIERKQIYFRGAYRRVCLFEENRGGLKIAFWTVYHEYCLLYS